MPVTQRKETETMNTAGEVNTITHHISDFYFVIYEGMR